MKMMIKWELKGFTLLVEFSIPANYRMLVNAIYNIVDVMFIGMHQNLDLLDYRY